MAFSTQSSRSWISVDWWVSRVVGHKTYMIHFQLWSCQRETLCPLKREKLDIRKWGSLAKWLWVWFIRTASFGCLSWGQNAPTLARTGWQYVTWIARRVCVWYSDVDWARAPATQYLLGRQLLLLPALFSYSRTKLLVRRREETTIQCAAKWTAGLLVLLRQRQQLMMQMMTLIMTMMIL